MPRRNPRRRCSIAPAANLAQARTPRTTARSRATAALWSMLTRKLRGRARTWLIRLMQRFGHENCRARLFLQGVAHKAGRLIHSQGLMIIVHHLQRQLAATELPGLLLHVLQQTPSDAFAANCR